MPKGTVRTFATFIAIIGLVMSAFAVVGMGTASAGVLDDDDNGADNGTPTNGDNGTPADGTPTDGTPTDGTPSGDDGTTTPAAGGAETEEAGPLTPVATPTTADGGVGGAETTPEAELPTTGTGTGTSDGGMTWLLMLGGAMALAGGAAVVAGYRR